MVQYTVEILKERIPVMISGHFFRFILALLKLPVSVSNLQMPDDNLQMSDSIP
jgi:hypothetical protein